MTIKFVPLGDDILSWDPESMDEYWRLCAQDLVSDPFWQGRESDFYVVEELWQSVCL